MGMKRVKTSIQRYWDWRSATYGYDHDKSVGVARKWESILKELVTDSPGKLALDIGTGTGQVAVYLARSGFRTTGIDISESMIRRARQHALEHGLHIDFQPGDAERLEFKDNTFDVVVSRNLVWTLPCPDQALKEWRRVMKPGATLVVSDGAWMNYTWRRVHHLAFKVFREKLRNGSVISARFFVSYAGVQRSLPFYEGIRFEEASALLHEAHFRDIRAYDTASFGLNPYRAETTKSITAPSFFIAYAKK
ncbi:MAG: methyltransferase domain-containing protein [Deltaproteobacteria bacterium]|nr:methyltransferase domain-containing protein [Deltaproteobacteria bacterium]